MCHFLPELCCRNQSFKQLTEYNFNFKSKNILWRIQYCTEQPPPPY